MTGEIYKVLMVDGEKVLCINTTDGFILEIGGFRYHVYGEDDGTHIDMLINNDEKEYIGKVNESWTGDEEEALNYILSYWATVS